MSMWDMPAVATAVYELEYEVEGWPTTRHRCTQHSQCTQAMPKMAMVMVASVYNGQYAFVLFFELRVLLVGSPVQCV